MAWIWTNNGNFAFLGGLLPRVSYACMGRYLVNISFMFLPFVISARLSFLFFPSVSFSLLIFSPGPLNLLIHPDITSLSHETGPALPGPLSSRCRFVSHQRLGERLQAGSSRSETVILDDINSVTCIANDDDLRSLAPSLDGPIGIFRSQYTTTHFTSCRQ
ncbi:hypothetical protein QBC32DRAFT_156138 [Pseudoneurospora amorphoporcata]|uniref:Uncharacterized protein n=1 Tax=Pseudoneurospora amorphoporcata TaxID=241081 RepID=A0AAN6P205_9PEZI|nr:hypothetical protein QBC32DRAFT_156138 [Pseudoneurospora amorphoporcata]